MVTAVVGDLVTAAELIVRSQWGSQDMLARKLRLAKDEAAELLEELEKAGVVGPPTETGARPVTFTSDELAEALAKVRQHAARGQLVIDTEALDEVHGGQVVLRGGLGADVVHPAGAVLEVRPDGDVELADDEPDESAPQHIIGRLVERPVHVITTLATSEEAKEVGGAALGLGRVLLRAVVTTLQGYASWSKRASDAATFGTYRRAIRAAEAAGDREAEETWSLALEKAKDGRTKRAKEKSGIVFSFLGLAATLSVVVFALVLAGGALTWAFPGGYTWTTWWNGVFYVLDTTGTVIRWTTWIGATAAIPVTAILAYREGKRAGRPPRWLVTRDEQLEMDSVIDERMVSLALANLGIPALNQFFKEGGHLEYRVVPRRDGDGTYTLVRLCLGVTAEMVIGRRDKLAGNLSRAPLECWPTQGDEASLLELWVADKGVLGKGAGPWPLLHDGTVNVFEGVPFGRSQRGEVVLAPLFENNWLIGGRPGQGKSNAARVLLLGAALDPTAELWVYVMGESPDFAPFEPRLSRYAMGMDDSVAAAALQGLRDALAEMERRGKVLSAQQGGPPKTSRKLANKQGLGLHPLIINIDECFPSGTLVGGVPIEQLRQGDVVPSWDETTGQPCDGEVRAIFRKRPNALVRVHWHNGTALVCTPNHPLMTRDGWVAAGDLTSTSEVLTYGQAGRADRRPVLDLRDTIHAPAVEARVLEAIRSGDLLGDLRDDGAAGERRADSHVAGVLCCDIAADAGAEPYAGCQRQTVGVSATPGDRASSTRRGWQWAGPVDGAAAAGGGAWVADGGHRSDWAAREGWSAESLQAGHRESGPEGGRGDRRDLAPVAEEEGAGRTEDCVADWRRVDRVEVLEPGSDGRYGGLCPDGFVYNFEVAGTHVYRVADGVVAHNCHELFQHKEYGKEAEDLAVRLIKRGRKYGIILLLETQSPTRDSIPREVTRNISCGVAYSVSDHVANDGLLGTGKYKLGIRATELRMNVDRGTCVSVGVTDNAFELVRTFYVPLEDGRDEVTPVIARAMSGIRELRRTGQPAALEAASIDHLRDVWEVLKEPREELRDVLPRLRDRDPETYTKWSQSRLAEFLEGERVTVGWLKGYKTVLAADVEEALTSRGAGGDDDAS